jgi:hypothetical protein
MYTESQKNEKNVCFSIHTVTRHCKIICVLKSVKSVILQFFFSVTVGPTLIVSNGSG